MKKSLLLLPLIFVLSPHKAYSQNINSVVPTRGNLQEQAQNRNEIGQEVQEGVQNRVQERVQQICAQVGERVRNRTENFETNREQHMERYGELKTKLQGVAVKLRARGFDTTQLETDLLELDSLVQMYANEYSNFIGVLQGSQEFACGQSQGEFHNALKDAQNQIIRAREARRAVWEFYKDNIREDIKSLRLQAEQMQEGNDE
ncbi:MAG: hypothetical protein ABH814_00855 [bacterium]